MRIELLAKIYNLALSAFVLLTFASISFGQSDLTSIAGTITDPSGAIVANANVTVRNEATGAERRAATNSSGNYSIPSIPAGMYTLMIDAPGFKKYERSGNTLQSSVAATLDASLTLGQSTETVQVTSEAPPVQADSATLGRNVNTIQIQNLQLNGRNPYLLSLLKPGVSGNTAIGGFSFAQGNGLNVNGSRTGDTLITQDGAVAVRTRANGSSIGVADADSTQEVQILTSNYNAEYGRASGGQIRITTKSGTRDFHGTAYEYFRNSALDANQWSRNNSPDPAINSQAAPFRFNQFGYNIGGPIFIPKHFNSDRTKLFFLFGQEFIKYRNTLQNNLSTTGFVPSLAMRRGDFSELLNPSNPFYGQAKTIHDPAGNPYPNNVIPANQLSPNGLALLNIFPQPNRTGLLNYQASAADPINQRKDTGSIDIVPGNNHYIRFRSLNYSYNEINPTASNYIVLNQLWDRPNQTVSTNWTWNVNPTFVNEFLASASRDQNFIGVDQSNNRYNRATYGITYPYLFPNGKNIPEKIPTVTLNGPFNELNALPYPSASKGPIYDISDNITKVTGNHTIKAGFLFERAGQNDYDQINIQGVPGGTNNQNGRFVFQDGTPSGTGLSVANAAIGRFDTYAELGTRSYTPYRGFMYEWFIQDSWKITPKLHLDYGLRQSIIKPFYSIWRNLSLFDPSYYNPANAVRVDPATGRPIAGSGDPYNGVVIPGNGFPASAHGRVPADDYPLYQSGILGLFHNLPKEYSDTHPIQGLQPRLGIAYAFDQKTVIRGGVGHYLSRLGISDSVLLGGNPPFQPSASVSFGSVDNPGGVGQNTFPLPITSQSRKFYNPEAYAWNLAVQRDVGFQTVIEVAYVGRRGLHLPQETNINQLLPGTTYTNRGVSPDALRPYKGFGAIRQTDNVASSIYHALQVDVNRRFSNGFLFGLAYTWSKSMDTGSSTRDVLPNTYGSRNLQYGYSDFDRRHVLVFNFIWELPFLKNKQTLAGKLLGGWQITEISQFQTGTPVSVQTTEDIAGVGPGSGNSGNSNNGFSTRYLVNGNIAQPAQFGNTGQWYAFQPGVNILRPANGTFSDQRSRNIFFQPGFQNWSAGLFKTFHTTETQFITARFEAFNWLNHPNWGGATGGGLQVNPIGANFGKIVTKDSQRQLQISLRYTF